MGDIARIQKSVKKANKKSTILYHIKAIASGCAAWLNKRVAIRVLLESLPVIWAIILQVFRTFFYSENGNLKKEGILIWIPIFLVSIIVSILTGIKSKRDNYYRGELNQENKSYNSMLSIVRKTTIEESIIEQAQYNQLKNWIETDPPGKEFCEIAKKVRHPEAIIQRIIEGLTRCFAEITQLDESKIFLSAAIAICNTNQPKRKQNKPSWKWFYQPRQAGTSSMEDLLVNNSSFKIVADGNPFFYANDKAVAEKEGKYCFDEKDKCSDNRGSIICFEEYEQVRNWKIRLIISISTYGQKLISQEDEELGIETRAVYEGIIRDTIIKQFECEIKECLLWYAVQNIAFQNEKQNKNEASKSKEQVA